MGYSNTSAQKQTAEKSYSFSAVNALQKMEAVPVLQKAEGEEMLQMKSIIQPKQRIIGQTIGSIIQKQKMVLCNADIDYTFKKCDGKIVKSRSGVTNVSNDTHVEAEIEAMKQHEQFPSTYNIGKYSENQKEAATPFFCAEPKAVALALSYIIKEKKNERDQYINKVKISAKPASAEALEKIQKQNPKYYKNSDENYIAPCPSCVNFIELLPK